MEKNSKIYIAGHSGMVGSALVRRLQKEDFTNIVTRELDELDLINQSATEEFFKSETPEYVFLAAAKVGGILANNTYRAQFIYENIQIQNNIIHSAYKYGVKKLLFLGSSCIYPKEAPQPLKEEYLLSGLLEQTNEPYAIAKISGIKMCESYYRQYGSNFISVMPTNLYGPNDNYDLEKSHVLPALIRKMHLGKCLENNNWEAILKDLDKNPVKDITGSSEKDQILGVLKEFGIQYIEHEPAASNQQPVTVKLWGTGKIYREFLHVNDMADACIHIMEHVEAEKLYTEMGQTHINIGTGIDLTIKDLAETVKGIVGFKGSINWDDTKPDGTYKKQLDTSLLNKLDWNFKIGLEEGISTVYQNYISQ